MSETLQDVLAWVESSDCCYGGSCIAMEVENRLKALAGWLTVASAPVETPVLTYRGAGLMAVAEHIPDPHDFGKQKPRWVWCCTDGVQLLNVTHWMPLPAPPQVQS